MNKDIIKSDLKEAIPKFFGACIIALFLIIASYSSEILNIVIKNQELCDEIIMSALILCFIIILIIGLFKLIKRWFYPPTKTN